jgi:hypothetical protein
VLALPAGFDAPRHAVALVPTSAGAQSNSAADLGLARQRAGVEPEVGMRFPTLGRYRSALRGRSETPPCGRTSAPRAKRYSRPAPCRLSSAWNSIARAWLLLSTDAGARCGLIFAPADAWSSSRAGAQELAAGSLVRASRRASCDVPVVAPSSGGCCVTRGTASTGKGARVQAECPQGVPFRTQHPLGVVVNRPSVGLTDDFSAPCWSVRRNRLTGG